MTRSILTLMLFALMAGTPAYSDGILFDASWKEQRFSLFSKNKYGFKGNRLDVSSRGSVSMAKFWTVHIWVLEGKRLSFGPPVRALTMRR